MSLSRKSIHYRGHCSGKNPRLFSFSFHFEKDLETARGMVAKEDGTIFVATDGYLANKWPLWQSVVSRAMLN